ncbi:hypothetical protein CHN51_07150 [Sphingorhabdus sp. YGSMI21]|nr:hypothetical protein CHN51_07150 [Sphingorhabdus sp. YGSMI21]
MIEAGIGAFYKFNTPAYSVGEAVIKIIESFFQADGGRIQSAGGAPKFVVDFSSLEDRYLPLCAISHQPEA